jgi:hypothetical protein
MNIVLGILCMILFAVILIVAELANRAVIDLQFRIAFLLHYYKADHFCFPDGETFYPIEPKETAVKLKEALDNS